MEPSHFLDLCRALVIALGGTTGLLLGYVMVRRGDAPVIAMAGLALLAVVQESEQIGEPFVPWRLPILGVSLAAALAHAVRLARRRGMACPSCGAVRRNGGHGGQ